jgi:hypothetical protein
MKQNNWNKDKDNLTRLYESVYAEDKSSKRAIQSYVVADGFESDGFQFTSGMTIAGYELEEGGKKSLVLTDSNDEEYGRISWSDQLSLYKPTNTGRIGGVISESIRQPGNTLQAAGPGIAIGQGIGGMMGASPATSGLQSAAGIGLTGATHKIVKDVETGEIVGTFDYTRRQEKRFLVNAAGKKLGYTNDRVIPDGTKFGDWALEEDLSAGSMDPTAQKVAGVAGAAEKVASLATKIPGLAEGTDNKDEQLILGVVDGAVSEALDKIGLTAEGKEAAKTLLEKSLRAGILDEGTLGTLSEGAGKGLFQGAGGAVLGGLAGSALDAATGGATGGLGRKIGTAAGGAAGLAHGLNN